MDDNAIDNCLPGHGGISLSTSILGNTPVATSSAKSEMRKSSRGAWHCPPEITNDLKDIDLPAELKAEILGCAFKHNGRVTPRYTNWDRYIAFMRIVVMGVVAEFGGSLADVTAGDDILGFNFGPIISALFGGTPRHTEMASECRTSLLITADKSIERQGPGSYSADA